MNILKEYIAKTLEYRLENYLIDELMVKFDKGVEKYGLALNDANLTEKQLLQHYKEEVQDSINYICEIIRNIGQDDDQAIKKSMIYHTMLARDIENLKEVEFQLRNK